MFQLDTPFKYLAWRLLDNANLHNFGPILGQGVYIKPIHYYSMVCCLFLVAILTITLILTDKIICCAEKIKPKRRSRDIDSLLISGRSTTHREASQEVTADDTEAIALEEIESGLAEPTLANPHSTNDREASGEDTPENPEECQLEEINSALGEPK